MAILQDDDARFRNLSRKIGVFLLIAGAGIVITLVAIGVQQELFTAKTRIEFITDSGREITEGMAVKLSGFRIGKVRRLRLTEDANVRVSLEISSEYMKWIRQDSRARLLKEGVIGDTVIEISPGSEQAPALAHRGQIEFEREVGMGQLIDQLYGDIRPLIADLRQTVKNANAVLAALPATRARLDTVLGSAQRNFENLEKVTESELPAAVRDGRRVVEDSGKVVDSLSRTWPISGGIERPKAGVLPFDSYTPAGTSKK
jgi:phospholipid/cholesterol/gamma-HCH transport system substrate-binding protein